MKKVIILRLKLQRMRMRATLKIPRDCRLMVADIGEQILSEIAYELIGMDGNFGDSWARGI